MTNSAKITGIGPLSETGTKRRPAVGPTAGSGDVRRPAPSAVGLEFAAGVRRRRRRVFFTLLYDPETGQFSALSVNGEA
jgi:hypothetical protein